MNDYKISYRQLPDAMYTDIRPVPVNAPRILIFNEALADFLALDKRQWRQAEVLSGNHMLPGSEPLAQAYIGHQFGHPAMLGDGRAHVLAEVIASDKQRYDIQLKGSGRTPYSRGGDGRAVVGPMLREYLISEAMHALGIPTSRSLAVVSTGEFVRRETLLHGAILTRVASSHLRVGTFQYAQLKDAIRETADYAIWRHYPECEAAANPYLCLYTSVVSRQAALIASWQSVGFIHGVMNTDNMTISGETIDYGPCAFLDTYKKDQVFSSIDHFGRYRYGQQPLIAKWNLARLGETLISLIDPDEKSAIQIIHDVLDDFDRQYEKAWLQRFNQKLGLAANDDSAFIETFLLQLEAEEKDFTNAFLSLMDAPDDDLFSGEAGRAWQASWRQRRSHASDLAHADEIMRRVNPRIIPRNHMVQATLDAAEMLDMKPFNTLLSWLSTPFAENAPAEYMEPSANPDSFVTYCGT